MDEWAKVVNSIVQKWVEIRAREMVAEIEYCAAVLNRLHAESRKKPKRRRTKKR